VKKISFALFATILVSLFASLLVLAQTEQLTLKMSRDWGYGGFNGDIEGLFSMKVTGPADLARVEYYIDETKIGEVSRSPFNLQFTTDNYPLGIHKLYAVGFSKVGAEYRSNVITANFVPKQSSLKIILPVLGVILVVILLATLGPLLLRRGKRLNLPLGAERNYGAGGGGICPKCHRPFPIPLLSAHIGFSKLAACPFCGKWSMIRVESLSKLREAERAELDWAKPDQFSQSSEEEKLNKEIDDSKYQGL
jgi:Bacterial Ig domain